MKPSFYSTLVLSVFTVSALAASPFSGFPDISGLRLANNRGLPVTNLYDAIDDLESQVEDVKQQRIVLQEQQRLLEARLANLYKKLQQSKPLRTETTHRSQSSHDGSISAYERSSGSHTKALPTSIVPLLSSFPSPPNIASRSSSAQQQINQHHQQQHQQQQQQHHPQAPLKVVARPPRYMNNSPTRPPPPPPTQPLPRTPSPDEKVTQDMSRTRTFYKQPSASNISVGGGRKKGLFAMNDESSTGSSGSAGTSKWKDFMLHSKNSK